VPIVGRLEQVWVFPVKSMRGLSMDHALVASSGLRGDRAWAVVRADGAPVTAAQEPRLRQVTPHLDRGRLTLDVPGAPMGLAPGEAATALSGWLGYPVRLTRREAGGFVDVAPVHVVSRGSMADVAHAEQCDACDVAEPRANLVVELEPDGPGERSWVGREIAVGAVRLLVVRRPDHCLGVYADVVAPGEVALGDQVGLG
jgi:MOSC domain-containing protein